MLSKIVTLSIGLVSLATPAYAKFVPDPTPPPVITQSSGTRYAANYGADANLPIAYPGLQALARQNQVALPTLNPAQMRCVVTVSDFRRVAIARKVPRKTADRNWVKAIRNCIKNNQGAA